MAQRYFPVVWDTIEDALKALHTQYHRYEDITGDGGTETLQDVLDEGATLDKDNVIDGADFSLIIRNFSTVQLQASQNNGLFLDDNYTALKADSDNYLEIDGDANTATITKDGVTKEIVTSVNGIEADSTGNVVTMVSGTSAAMTAGTVTVNTAAVTADSKIFLSHAVPIGTLGWLTPGTIVPGVSFVINSTGATDLSTVNWLIIKE